MPFQLRILPLFKCLAILTLGVVVVISAPLRTASAQADASSRPESSPLATSPASTGGRADSFFAAGVEAFKKNDLKTATVSFERALSQDPQSTTALHNLALIEWKNGHTGLAVALWRRALSVNGSYRPAANAISWARTKMDHAEIAHEVEYWEMFRDDVLGLTSLDTLAVVSAILLLIAGWMLLRYFGSRRRAVLDQQPSPEFPTVALALCALFVSLAAVTLAKTYDATVDRGTIITPHIEARSAPDAASTGLFDLYEGLEVILDQTSNRWIQVTYPGGPTGWIPASSVFRTSASATLRFPNEAPLDGVPAAPANLKPGEKTEGGS